MREPLVPAVFSRAAEEGEAEGEKEGANALRACVRKLELGNVGRSGHDSKVQPLQPWLSKWKKSITGRLLRCIGADWRTLAAAAHEVLAYELLVPARSPRFRLAVACGWHAVHAREQLLGVKHPRVQLLRRRLAMFMVQRMSDLSSQSPIVEAQGLVGGDRMHKPQHPLPGDLCGALAAADSGDALADSTS